MNIEWAITVLVAMWFVDSAMGDPMLVGDGKICWPLTGALTNRRQATLEQCLEYCKTNSECNGLIYFTTSSQCNLYKQMCDEASKILPSTKSYKFLSSDPETTPRTTQLETTPATGSEDFVLVGTDKSCSQSTYLRASSSDQDTLGECQESCRIVDDCNGVVYDSRSRCMHYSDMCDEADLPASGSRSYKFVQTEDYSLVGEDKYCSDIRDYTLLKATSRSQVTVDVCLESCTINQDCVGVIYFRNSGSCRHYDGMCDTATKSYSGISSYKSNLPRIKTTITPKYQFHNSSDIINVTGNLLLFLTTLVCYVTL